MKKSAIIIIAIILQSCTSEKIPPKEIVNENFNFIIAIDLSNRIETNRQPKPVSDTVLISYLYQSYYPNLYKINNRVIGQKDKISIIPTNPKIISDFNINMNNLTWDFSNMNSKEIIEYLANGGNKNDVEILKKEIKNIYANALENTTGGDVYNFLKTQINSITVKKDVQPATIHKTIVHYKNRNVVILFTDGYIEAGLYGPSNCKNKKCFYLDGAKIKEFREAYEGSGENDINVFFKKSGFGIIPLNNDYLKNTEIIIVEMYDRSLNEETGSQTVSPNDFEIMKLFWSDWLEKSGVKRHKLISITNSKEDFLLNIEQFLKS